jgi:hypothetical protein
MNFKSNAQRKAVMSKYKTLYTYNNKIVDKKTYQAHKHYQFSKFQKANGEYYYVSPYGTQITEAQYHANKKYNATKTQMRV